MIAKDIQTVSNWLSEPVSVDPKQNVNMILTDAVLKRDIDRLELFLLSKLRTDANSLNALNVCDEVKSMVFSKLVVFACKNLSDEEAIAVLRSLQQIVELDLDAPSISAVVEFSLSSVVSRSLLSILFGDEFINW
jgi:hypothetical protein